MIKLLITDLDNTLYNWVDFYVPAFNAMLTELVKLTGLDESALRSSFKRVHEKHKTTEYAFSIQELDVLASESRGLTTREILEKYGTAIKAFRLARQNTLCLYPTVEETLEILRRQGRVIVAHTDAMMYYAVQRLKQLGIESMFDGIVAPRDHGLPAGTKPEDVRSYSDPDRYETTIRYVSELDPEILKPNRECICRILSHFNVANDEAIYVGDSLYKDIYMAQSCGVYDVLAEYGKTYDEQNYLELVEITHWTEEDVAREKAGQIRTIEPTFNIDCFGELLGVIEIIEQKTGVEKLHQA